MARPHYFAVRPKGRVEAVRVEKAETAEGALRLAFGHQLYKAESDLAKIDHDTWEIKDLGGSVQIMRVDKRRIAALTSTEGWKSPYDMPR